MASPFTEAPGGPGARWSDVEFFAVNPTVETSTCGTLGQNDKVGVFRTQWKLYIDVHACSGSGSNLVKSQKFPQHRISLHSNVGVRRAEICMVELVWTGIRRP